MAWIRFRIVSSKRDRERERKRERAILTYPLGKATSVSVRRDAVTCFLADFKRNELMTMPRALLPKPPQSGSAMDPSNFAISRGRSGSLACFFRQQTSSALGRVVFFAGGWRCVASATYIFRAWIIRRCSSSTVLACHACSRVLVGYLVGDRGGGQSLFFVAPRCSKLGNFGETRGKSF